MGLKAPAPSERQMQGQMRGFFVALRMTNKNRQRRRFWLRQNDDFKWLRQNDGVTGARMTTLGVSSDQNADVT